MQEISPGVVTLACRGDFHNRDHIFLDGRTRDGSVGLAPSTNGGFTGTKWATAVLAKPTLGVVTTRNQTGAKLELTGSGFTGNDGIEVSAEGLVGRRNHAPFALGVVINTKPDGTFHGFVDVHIFPTQPPGLEVVIRATDHHGVSATGVTSGFNP